MTPLVPLVPLAATKATSLAVTPPPTSPWWYAVAGTAFGLLLSALVFFLRRWIVRRDKKEETLEAENRRLSFQLQEVKEQLTSDIQEVKNTTSRIDERTFRLPCLQGGRGNGVSGNPCEFMEEKTP